MKKIKDESGQTLIMVALGMTMLLGFAGFATDVGVMLHEKRELQSAADSAALAGASAMNSGGTATTAQTAGENDVALNGFSGATVTINTPPTDDPNPNINTAGYVEAIVTQSSPTFFMRLFGHSSLSVSARAVATYKGQSSACGYVLNPTNSVPAANPWGNSTISSPGCGWDINGNLVLGASDSMAAAYVGASGTITGASDITGASQAGIAPISNPLPQLSSTLPTIKGTTCSVPDGTYCALNQPLSGTLKAGTYVYTIAADATYTGAVNGTAGVTIVLLDGTSLTSTTGGSGKGNASLDLTAPQNTSTMTYTYNGIVIDAPTYTGDLDLDFGATNVTLTGIVYAPEADLSLQDQGATVTLNADLILGTLDVGDKNKGNLTLNGYSPTGGTSPLTKIALVE